MSHQNLSNTFQHGDMWVKLQRTVRRVAKLPWCHKCGSSESPRLVSQKGHEKCPACHKSGK